MNLNLSSDNACAKAPASRCSLLASSIPKGLCNSAQGCEERATLGKATDDSQPQRGCGMVLFPWSSATTLSGLSPMWRTFSQGSSFLATLGFVAESLWDSALGATHSKMQVRSSGLPSLSHVTLTDETSR